MKVGILVIAIIIMAVITYGVWTIAIIPYIKRKQIKDRMEWTTELFSHLEKILNELDLFLRDNPSHERLIEQLRSQILQHYMEIIQNIRSYSDYKKVIEILNICEINTQKLISLCRENRLSLEKISSEILLNLITKYTYHEFNEEIQAYCKPPKLLPFTRKDTIKSF